MALKNYCYFVEGADEKKIIDTLETDMKLISLEKCMLLIRFRKKSQ
jgi:hypothetical protein